MYQKYAPTCHWSPHGLFRLNTGWHCSFLRLIQACAVNTGPMVNYTLHLRQDEKIKGRDNKPVSPRKNSMYQNSKHSRTTKHKNRVHIKMQCYRVAMLTISYNITRHIASHCHTNQWCHFMISDTKKSGMYQNILEYDNTHWKSGRDSNCFKMLQTASNIIKHQQMQHSEKYRSDTFLTAAG